MTPETSPTPRLPRAPWPSTAARALRRVRILEQHLERETRG